MQAPDSALQVLTNYGVLGIVLVLLLTGMLVTRGHLDMVRGLADRALTIAERQVEATTRLSAAVERAIDDLREQAQGGAR